MENSIVVFTKNPYWKNYYESSPSETVKTFIEYIFYFSFCAIRNIEVDSNFVEEKKRIENKLTKSDWQYLIDNTENQIAKSHYKKKQLLAKD